jgi:hypothetical protein
MPQRVRQLDIGSNEDAIQQLPRGTEERNLGYRSIVGFSRGLLLLIRTETLAEELEAMQDSVGCLASS